MNPQLEDLLREYLLNEVKNEKAEMGCTSYAIESKEIFKTIKTIYEEESFEEAWSRIDRFFDKKEEIFDILLQLKDASFIDNENNVKSLAKEISYLYGTKNVFSELFNSYRRKNIYKLSDYVTKEVKRKDLPNYLCEDTVKNLKKAESTHMFKLIKDKTDDVKSTFKIVEREAGYITFNESSDSNTHCMSSAFCDTKKGRLCIIFSNVPTIFLIQNDKIEFIELMSVYKGGGFERALVGECAKKDYLKGFTTLSLNRQENSEKYYSINVGYEEETDSIIHEIRDKEENIVFKSYHLQKLNGKAIAFGLISPNSLVPIFDKTLFNRFDFYLTDEQEEVFNQVIKLKDEEENLYDLKDIGIAKELNELLELNFAY